MNEQIISQLRPGQTVISADGITVGRIDADSPTHVRVRTRADAQTDHLWLPKGMVRSVEGDTVHLNALRADLHEAVLSLPPGQQREFGTLGLNVRIGRARGIGPS